jgi:hypothetical protein
MHQQRKLLWLQQQRLELAQLERRLVQVLVQQLVLALELVQLLLEPRQRLEQERRGQQSRHRNLEQQSLVSSLHCASIDLMRYRFSTANCPEHCASCRCSWLNHLQKLNPQLLLLQTALRLCLVSSFILPFKN